MSSRLYIGLDAGGSHVHGLLGSAAGEVLSEALIAEGANPNFVGIETSAKRLEKAISELWKEGEVCGVFAAVAGALTGDNSQRLASLLTARFSVPVRIGSDVLSVFAAKPDLPEAAICVLLGTGFSVFARTAYDAPLLRVRGWGARFEQSASGYALGRNVVREALREDERRAICGEGLAPSPLLAAVRARLCLAEGVPLTGVLDRLLQMPVRDIASFARFVFDSSICPESLRLRLLHGMVEEVSEAIDELVRLSPVPVQSVLFSGGIASAAFPGMLPLLAERFPGFRFHLPSLTPAEGALRHARRLFSIPFE
ncbi:MAG: N-acetylglucosamine kinase [Kiritimatiellia bacterium]